MLFRSLTTISDMGNRSDEAKARSQKSDEELKRMESDVKELQMQKEKIASRFLRLTTLKPGQSVSGLVQFPLSSSSKASGQQMVLKNSAVSAPANTLLFQILKVQ